MTEVDTSAGGCIHDFAHLRMGIVKPERQREIGEKFMQVMRERDALQAEVDRLNKWADGFSDAQLKERKLCEDRIQEVQRENDRLRVFAGDFANYRFIMVAERTGPEPDDHGDRFTGYDMVAAFQEDARAALKGGDA